MKKLTLWVSKATLVVRSVLVKCAGIVSCERVRNKNPEWLQKIGHIAKL